jgi:hypothetical protein
VAVVGLPVRRIVVDGEVKVMVWLALETTWVSVAEVPTLFRSPA